MAVFFNIFVNPIALEAIAWKYYVVYVVILVFILHTIYFFYPETNEHSLEEMARVFDGDDAAVPAEGVTFERVQERRESMKGGSVVAGVEKV
jgi:Sugar (and other) transporter